MRYWIISILVGLAWSSSGECQQAKEDNKLVYEGQNVAAVDLIANPNISVGSLRALVEQRVDRGNIGIQSVVIIIWPGQCGLVFLSCSGNLFLH